MDCHRSSAKREFVALNAYIRKEELFKINDLSFQPKDLKTKIINPKNIEGKKKKQQ